MADSTVLKGRKVDALATLRFPKNLVVLVALAAG